MAGDITVEWLFARSRSPVPSADNDPHLQFQAYRNFGGAALIGAFIERANESTRQSAVVIPKPSNEFAIPGTPPYWHWYHLVAQYPISPQHSDGKSADKTVWRVRDRLGLDRQEPTGAENLLKGDHGNADIIVLNAARQGFWEAGYANGTKMWPRSLERPNGNAWMLLKLTRPDLQQDSAGSPLSYCAKNFGGRLIAIVRAEDLRLSGMVVSRRLSWETTAQDLYDAISRNVMLKNCTHVVASLGLDAALLVSKSETDSGTTATLYYDPNNIEGDWEQQYRPAVMVGYQCCMAAGIAYEMIACENLSDTGKVTKCIGDGVIAGVEAGRSLLKNGFISPPSSTDSSSGGSPFPAHLAFPIEAVSESLVSHEKSSLQKTNVTYGDKNWAILKNCCAASELTLTETEIIQLTLRIVECGKFNFNPLPPRATFGELVAYDRVEIEGLRVVTSLIDDYLASQATAPLSIAMFGAPGVGKSFTARNVAKSRPLLGPPLTFNLSQFKDTHALNDALHQVRDEALRGKPPLVLWDEFDVTVNDTKFWWLPLFLAPMQDGKFQEGPIAHNIGRSVFLFAGGVCTSMHGFRTAIDSANSPGSKNKDFLSRLKGFVNLKGLNYEEVASREPAIAVCRAYLLRKFLLQSAKPLAHDAMHTLADGCTPELCEQHIRIHEGVLKAFILTKSFEYGARSIESIVQMSQLDGREIYDPSSLPTSSQLTLHVVADSFMQHVAQPPIDG
ncbi:MAG: ATP-binding protein [Firmicutes bacterium]|nr:ATP-binding protein [Bacillota bacterium]